MDFKNTSNKIRTIWDKTYKTEADLNNLPSISIDFSSRITQKTPSFELITADILPNDPDEVTHEQEGVIELTNFYEKYISYCKFIPIFSFNQQKSPYIPSPYRYVPIVQQYTCPDNSAYFYLQTGSSGNDIDCYSAWIQLETNKYLYYYKIVNGAYAKILGSEEGIPSYLNLYLWFYNYNQYYEFRNSKQ